MDEDGPAAPFTTDWKCRTSLSRQGAPPMGMWA